MSEPFNSSDLRTSGSADDLSKRRLKFFDFRTNAVRRTGEKFKSSLISQQTLNHFLNPNC